MEKFLISVDQSLRSTGVCVFSDNLYEKSKLVDFTIIKTKAGNNIYEEDDLIQIQQELWDIIDPYWVAFNIVFEGLSLGSISSRKDIIYGLHWFLRTEVRSYHPDSLIGVISVAEWRNWFTTIEERKIAKEKYPKNYLKWVVVDKIKKDHSDVLEKFYKYIEKNKFSKDSIFDLCDAYGLGLYRLTLKINTK